MALLMTMYQLALFTLQPQLALDLPFMLVNQLDQLLLGLDIDLEMELLNKQQDQLLRVLVADQLVTSPPSPIGKPHMDSLELGLVLKLMNQRVMTLEL